MVCRLSIPRNGGTHAGFDSLSEVGRVVSDSYPALAIEQTDPAVVSGLLDVPGDFFQVRIVFSSEYPAVLPAIFETGGRTALTMRKRQVPLNDLHYMPDGRACLCVPQEERLFVNPHSPFETFMANLVVPFFYSQAVFDRDGIWPFGERAHGLDGVWEFYSERLGNDFEMVLACMRRLARGDRPRSHWSCPCGSGRSVAGCHPQVFQGMVQVHSMLDRHRISADLEKFATAVDAARRTPATRSLAPWA